MPPKPVTHSAYWQGFAAGISAGFRRAGYDLVRQFIRAIAWTTGILVALLFFVHVLGPWLKANGWMS